MVQCRNCVSFAISFSGVGCTPRQNTAAGGLTTARCSFQKFSECPSTRPILGTHALDTHIQTVVQISAFDTDTENNSVMLIACYKASKRKLPRRARSRRRGFAEAKPVKQSAGPAAARYRVSWLAIFLSQQERRTALEHLVRPATRGHFEHGRRHAQRPRPVARCRSRVGWCRKRSMR